MILEFRPLEDIPVPIGLIDGIGDQHRIPPPISERGLLPHVPADVPCDALDALLAGEEVLKLRPAVFQPLLGLRRQPLRLAGELGIEVLRVFKLLLDVTRFIAQIAHNLVLHRLIELVGVDEVTEVLSARQLQVVALHAQKRRT